MPRQSMLDIQMWQKAKSVEHSKVLNVHEKAKFVEHSRKESKLNLNNVHFVMHGQSDP